MQQAHPIGREGGRDGRLAQTCLPSSFTQPPPSPCCTSSASPLQTQTYLVASLVLVLVLFLACCCDSPSCVQTLISLLPPCFSTPHPACCFGLEIPSCPASSSSTLQQQQPRGLCSVNVWVWGQASRACAEISSLHQSASAARRGGKATGHTHHIYA